MELLEKLKILSNSAKYDVSCATSKATISGGSRARIPGICHSFSSDGRCVSLLKILLTNMCEYDCKYCINRKSNNVKRTAFTPNEIAYLTTEFYKRNYIEGLFLSSAVLRNPDHTMELMLRTIKKLRKDYGFRGYIHAKIMPDADSRLIEEILLYADRVSVNIELPEASRFLQICPDKRMEKILKTMHHAKEKLIEKFEKKLHGGQSTQLIIGATPDTDYKILELSSKLYSDMRLRRVYYSAFVKVNDDESLPSISNPPLLREHRLYQADWLLRVYKFKLDEIIEKEQNLPLEFDPKTHWALRNLDMFPIEINSAYYEELIRVPGIGIRGAKKIIMARKYSRLSFDDMKKLRISMKKAVHFLKFNGKYFGKIRGNHEKVKELLVEYKQGSLFEDSEVLNVTAHSANTGEL